MKEAVQRLGDVLGTVYEKALISLAEEEAETRRLAIEGLATYEKQRTESGWSLLPAKQRARFENAAEKLRWHLQEIDHPSPEVVKPLVDEATALLESAFERYAPTLAIKRRQLVQAEYGGSDVQRWKRELQRFLAMNPDAQQALTCLREADARMKVRVDWEELLGELLERRFPTCPLTEGAPVGDGLALEHLCADRLRELGWEVQTTPVSGDQGVDLVARKGGYIAAVQCKNTAQPVGNGAVQEVFAGKTYYEAHVAAVVAPGGFTPGARQLADRVGVLLLDLSQLSFLENRVREEPR